MPRERDERIETHCNRAADHADAKRVENGADEVVLLEDAKATNPTYTVTLREPPATLKSLSEEIATVEFPSARAALITAERSCNRALYMQHRGAHKVDFSA